MRQATVFISPVSQAFSKITLSSAHSLCQVSAHLEDLGLDVLKLPRAEAGDVEHHVDLARAAAEQVACVQKLQRRASLAERVQGDPRSREGQRLPTAPRTDPCRRSSRTTVLPR